MMTLAVVEVKDYLTPKTSSQVFVGTDHSSDTFPANIDITFPYTPCNILSITENGLLKHRLDRNGIEIGLKTEESLTDVRNKVRKAFQE